MKINHLMSVLVAQATYQGIPLTGASYDDATRRWLATDGARDYALIYDPAPQSQTDYRLVELQDPDTWEDPDDQD